MPWKRPLLHRRRRPGRVGLAVLPLLLLAVLLPAVLATVGCDDTAARLNADRTVSAGHPLPADAKVFRFINRGDVFTLDLNRMSYLQDFRITYAIREGLYTYDPEHDFTAAPALATRTESPDGGRTYRFSLRPDARWSNGDPVVAGDFVFSWRLMLESPGEYTSLFYYIDRAEDYKNAIEQRSPMDFSQVGARAVDDHTFEVRLKKPMPLKFVEELFAFPPFYPRHSASMEPFRNREAGDRLAYFDRYTREQHVVTNGPYKLQTWRPGAQIVLVPDEQYWDRASVKLSRVEMVVVDDPNSAYTRFLQGKVHWMSDVDADIAFRRRRANDSKLKVVQPAFGTAYLTVNCAAKVPELGSAKNPLSDPRVRQALAMAIDKRYIVDRITQMGEQPAEAYVPPGFFDGWTSTPAPAYDLARANRLLDEAGYADRSAMPTLSIAYSSTNAVRRMIAEFLVQEWTSKLRVPIAVRPLDSKSASEYVRGKKYTLALAAWYGDYMDPSTFTDKYKSDCENNDSNWGGPAYDGLLEAAIGEPDARKRTDLLMRAEAMINTDLPIIPLYYYTNVTMQQDNVEGLLPNSKNLIVWKRIRLKD